MLIISRAVTAATSLQLQHACKPPALPRRTDSTVQGNIISTMSPQQGGGLITTPSTRHLASSRQGLRLQRPRPQGSTLSHRQCYETQPARVQLHNCHHTNERGPTSQTPACCRTYRQLQICLPRLAEKHAVVTHCTTVPLNSPPAFPQLCTFLPSIVPLQAAMLLSNQVTVSSVLCRFESCRVLTTLCVQHLTPEPLPCCCGGSWRPAAAGWGSAGAPVP